MTADLLLLRSRRCSTCLARLRAERPQDCITLGRRLVYDRAGANPIADLKRFNGLILRSYTVLNPSYPDPLPPGEATPDLPTNLVELAPASHLPYSTHYSIGVERQIGSHASLAATYRGVVGSDLFRSRDINAPRPPDYLTVPNPQFGVIREIEFEGRQVQNALDVTLQVKLSR
jgi:hypothetical protein